MIAVCVTKFKASGGLMVESAELYLSRRQAMLLAAAAGGSALWRPTWAADAPLIAKAIPGSGQRLPVIGIGTNSFSLAKIDELRPVLKRMVELGAAVIDTAASYGESEQVIGQLLSELGIRDKVFLATKLTGGPQQMPPGGPRGAGPGGPPGGPGGPGGPPGGGPPPNMGPQVYGKESLDRSLERLKTDHLDLLQVHNMNGIEKLWPQLNEWKQAKKIRYIGMTTSNSEDHPKMVQLMQQYQVDFVQVNYSIANRDAAATVFPQALQRKIAVIANVPLGGRGGANLNLSKDRPLPPFAAELGVTDWAQLMLKYVVSHPAVTCTIAGSTKVDHLEDNQQAGRGKLPDEGMRRRIEQYWDSQR